MRGLSIAMVLVAALVAYGVYLRPSERQLTFARTRLSVAQGELATLLGRAVIEPRLRRERQEIAKRLSTLNPYSPSATEAQFVTQAAALATQTGTHVTQIVSKGAMLPLAQTASPSPAHTPLAMSNEIRGVRLPRTLTVEGRFGSLLRFLDGLGTLNPIVHVNGAGFAQTDKLRATIDFDLVVVDAAQVREALQ